MQALEWDRQFGAQSGRRHWPNEELVRFVGSQQFESVLEVGCGDGANLLLLVDHASVVCGLDVSPVALALADEVVTARDPASAVYLRLGDATDPLPYTRESMDLVVDCMVSQHLPWSRHAAVFDEYRRVLRPGGRLWLFHLGSRTLSERGRAVANEQYDFEGLGLFPSVGYFCLPPTPVLVKAVASCGFSVTERWLLRGYPDGQVAHYMIAEATKI